jgi:hypothetical protein
MKYYAVITDVSETKRRYLAADVLLSGRPKTFKLVEDVKDAYPFNDELDASTAARIVLRDRLGRMLSGGFCRYKVEIDSPAAPEIIKTPETERRLPETPELPRFAGPFNVVEAFEGAAPKPQATGPVFDWKGDGDELYAALAAIIDSIDYTNQACRPNEAVGAVLDRILLDRAKDKMSIWRSQCYRFASLAEPEAFGPL